MKNAERGGYAIGAFNVYNLEGIEAVVAAAEEERSSAILQVQSFHYLCTKFIEFRLLKLKNLYKHVYNLYDML